MLKWTKALRSGNYKQGRFQLRNKENEFCCLGVLCNLHAEEHPEIAKTEYDAKSYMGHCILLPYEVMQWAGLSYGSGRFYDKWNNETSLASLNDNKTSFSNIADIIEENYQNL